MCARASVRARLSDAFDCLLSNCPEANVLTRRCPFMPGFLQSSEDAQTHFPGWIWSGCWAVDPGVWIALSRSLESANINLLPGTSQGQESVLQPSCFRYLHLLLLARRIFTFWFTAFEAKSSALRTGLLYKIKQNK